MEIPSRAENQLRDVPGRHPNLVLGKVHPLIHESGFLWIRAQQIYLFPDIAH